MACPLFELMLRAICVEFIALIGLKRKKNHTIILKTQREHLSEFICDLTFDIFIYKEKAIN